VEPHKVVSITVFLERKHKVQQNFGKLLNHQMASDIIIDKTCNNHCQAKSESVAAILVTVLVIHHVCATRIVAHKHLT
jgi:hypothetical protein